MSIPESTIVPYLVDINKLESKTAKLFPNGLFSIYLNGRTASMKLEGDSKIYQIWVVSFLDNLKNEPTLTLEELIASHRIGAVHIQNNVVKSITLTKEKIEKMTISAIRGMAFLEEDTISLIKEEYALKSFVSDEQYIQYTNALKFESNPALLPPTLISEKQTTVGHELKSEALPEGIIAAYLRDKVITQTDKNTGQSIRYWCVSFFDSIVIDSNTTLADLIKDRQVCALHVQNGALKSLTLTKEKLQLIHEHGIKKIAIVFEDGPLLVKEDPILKAYVSDNEYRKYTLKIINNLAYSAFTKHVNMLALAICSISTPVPTLPISEQISHIDVCRWDPKILPDSVLAMYLHDIPANGTLIKTDKTSRYAFISFLNDLSSLTQICELIKNRKICALHVQNGIIKSLTLTPEKIQILKANEIKEIAIFFNNRIFLIEKDIIMRPFVSDVQYIRYTSDLI